MIYVFTTKDLIILNKSKTMFFFIKFWLALNGSLKLKFVQFLTKYSTIFKYFLIHLENINI